MLNCQEMAKQYGKNVYLSHLFFSRRRSAWLSSRLGSVTADSQIGAAWDARLTRRSFISNSSLFRLIQNNGKVSARYEINKKKFIFFLPLKIWTQFLKVCGLLSCWCLGGCEAVVADVQKPVFLELPVFYCNVGDRTAYSAWLQTGKAQRWDRSSACVFIMIYSTGLWVGKDYEVPVWRRWEAILSLVVKWIKGGGRQTVLPLALPWTNKINSITGRSRSYRNATQQQRCFFFRVSFYRICCSRDRAYSMLFTWFKARRSCPRTSFKLLRVGLFWTNSSTLPNWSDWK